MIRLNRTIAPDAIFCALVLMAGCSPESEPVPPNAGNAVDVSKPDSGPLRQAHDAAPINRNDAAPINRNAADLSQLSPGQHVIIVSLAENENPVQIWRADGEPWSGNDQPWPTIGSRTELTVISDDGNIENAVRMVKASASELLIRSDLHDGNFSPDKPAQHTFLIQRWHLRRK